MFRTENGACRYNPNVQCEYGECRDCGWNEKEAERRKEIEFSENVFGLKTKKVGKKNAE